MTFSTVHYSAITVEHETPAQLFAELHKEFRFNLDAAARGEDESLEEFHQRKMAHAKRARDQLLKKGIERSIAVRRAIKLVKKLKRFRKNNKCAHYFDENRSALERKWCRKDGSPARVWCNPPYGRGLYDWIQRGDEAVRLGESDVVVWLLPARTDTRWFHDFFWDDAAHEPRPGIEIRLRKGRVKFGRAKSGAPFPTMVVIVRKAKR